MLYHRILSILRFLGRNKLYTAVNLIGLTMGLTVVLVIGLYIQQELAFDRFHSRADNIYRLVSRVDSETESYVQATSPLSLLPQVAGKLPEIADYTRVTKRSGALVKIGSQRYKGGNILVADEGFFRLFDFKLQSGDTRTALASPYSVLLTEALARKYFGSADPIGSTITMYQFDQGDGATYTVTGIVEKAPEHSHLSYDMIVSLNTMEEFLGADSRSPVYSYVLASETAGLEHKLNVLYKSLPVAADASAPALTFQAQPLKDIHLQAGYRHDQWASTTDGTRLLGFAALGLLVLLLAIGNYLNLAAAYGIKRSKETGIRKILGGSRSDIVARQLTEALLLNLLAALLSVGLIELGKPWFAGRFGFGLPELYQWEVLLLLVPVIVFSAGLSALAPALRTSRFTPVQLLKGMAAGSEGKSVFRQLIVGFQFTVAFLLTGCILIISEQVGFLTGFEPGYRREGVVVVYVNGDSEIIKNYGAFENEVRQSAVLGGAARHDDSILGGLGSRQVQIVQGEAAPIDVSVNTVSVDDHFLGLMQIDLLAGRNFSPAFGAEQQEAVIVNQSVLILLGVTLAEEALGKAIRFDGQDRRVVGVVKDFHTNSLYQGIEPLVMLPIRQYFSRISVSLPADRLVAAMDELQAIWDKVYPGSVMDYYFVDEQLKAQYSSERSLGQFLSLMAVLSIVISGLGLFGFCAFVMEGRTKEMGIRKVLGARAMQLFSLSAAYFFKLIGFAALVALPVVWLLMQSWLSGFAYHTEMQWWHFLTAVLTGYAIAFVSIVFHVARASSLNPVDVLRNE